MADLGFVRNESARQLRAGRSRTIGYVMLDATNPFFTDVAQGMEHLAEDRDLSLFLCNSDNRASREAAHLGAPPGAAGAGHPGHAGRPGLPHPRRPRRAAAPPS